MILLVKLVLAHLIGDFIIQPKSWVKNKEKKKLKSPKLYLHVGIHIALLFLIVWDVSYWPLLLIIGALHFIIDALKLLFQTKRTKRRWFFIDQLLHIISIFAAYFLYRDMMFSTADFPTETALLLLTCLLFLTVPVSIIMQAIFSKWNIEKLTKGNESLKDAGKYIGILERILVFIFIIMDHWEAVGFLITAKSVFRFGDLKESKQRKLTEYILIGTLISFGIAIVTGVVFRFLM
ncbi:DUF3307 domain-containing protein [Bizionia argentinensis JUB59]|uniref:DUF3307 domain-containing protein n=2 Tax=Bizionia TaxID=283785 RepID=G2EC29_9FLAO|nr:MULTISPECIES: DUF3307 domain-containing protein [Bizionia]EGV43972.1 DUF3307 domain-containing protein [Bizionia argentinensis JUB59]TYB77187.1 DUF3307 domain-containing protein [Bizionia myxarmorum]